MAALEEHTVTLQDDIDPFVIEHEEAVKVMQLTFARTVASMEGKTLPGILRLHDGSNWRKLFVGLSQGTAAADVEVERPPPAITSYHFSRGD